MRRAVRGAAAEAGSGVVANSGGGGGGGCTRGSGDKLERDAAVGSRGPSLRSSGSPPRGLCGSAVRRLHGPALAGPCGWE